MKLRAVVLFIMIVWSASLHWVELLGRVTPYPLYPVFPLAGTVSYDLFWTLFWTLAAVIMLTLLGSGTVVKTKNVTETHIHQDREEIARLNKEIKELRDGKKGE